MAHAGGLRVRGAAEDGAGVRVDELVAGGPPGAVVDGAGGLVAGVEGVEEARARDHLVAGREEEATVGPGGAVVGAGERDPVVDIGLAAQVLQVVAAGEATHRVADDVDLGGAGGGLDLVDPRPYRLGDDGVRLRAAEGVGEEAVGLPAVGLEAGAHGVPGAGVAGVAVDEEDGIDVAGAGRPARRGEEAERERGEEQSGEDETAHGVPPSYIPL